MSHNSQKEYFEIAYRTGSDVWTHIPYHHVALAMMPKLPENAMILDVGAGRGLWISKLVAQGYRAIGLEYLSEVVRKANQDIKREGFTDKARFVYGDVRDIPLADHSFEMVTDVGVFQHLGVIDWHQYVTEIKRMLKPGGYVLNISLSKQTPRFLGFNPKASAESQFEKFGVSYFFVENEELNNLFSHHGFTLVEQRIENFDAKTDPGDSLSLVFSLYKLG